ncbi:MAG TPA: hypothetical protein VEQ85_03185, partial [Lacipirellulaceae bacterium]|nr:hypothetical protein [Lacipirellulaceae bacterium]
MAYLLDTGIILRLADKNDALRTRIESAVGLLIRGREELYITTQNVAEFWNVATRPVANNGLALAPEAAGKLFDDAISAICTILPERDDVPAQLRRLL